MGNALPVIWPNCYDFCLLLKLFNILLLTIVFIFIFFILMQNIKKWMNYEGKIIAAERRNIQLVVTMGLLIFISLFSEWTNKIGRNHVLKRKYLVVKQLSEIRKIVNVNLCKTMFYCFSTHLNNLIICICAKYIVWRKSTITFLNHIRNIN